MEHSYEVRTPDGRHWVMPHEHTKASYRRAKLIARVFVSRAPIFVKAFVADMLMTRVEER